MHFSAIASIHLCSIFIVVVVVVVVVVVSFFIRVSTGSYAPGEVGTGVGEVDPQRGSLYAIGSYLL